MGEFLSFMGGTIPKAVEEGLIYALLALGLFISFRILNTTDLTTEGSFALGAAVSAAFTVQGKPILGLILGLCSGALAGMVTALLQIKLKIQPILAGILVMTGLYSINFRVMDNKPTITIMSTDTIFTSWRNIFGKTIGNLLVACLIVSICFLFLFLFLKTHTGLSLRATGDNEEMVEASSINMGTMKIIGLAIANGLIALSGALLAQYQRSADLSMGVGIVVVGLASLIVGEACFKGRFSVLRGLISAVVGSIIYRIIISLIYSLNFPPSDVKLISALIVVIAVAVPEIQRKQSIKRKMRE